MQEYPVRVHRVTVIFNTKDLPAPDDFFPNPITLVGDDFIVDQELNKKKLSIPQGISLIAFDLLQLPVPTAEEPKAVFGHGGGTAADTIVWTALDDTAPDPTPITPSPAFIVQPYFPSLCTITDINTDRVGNEHAFRVFVYYEGTGRAYNSDPVIVNEPPMG